MCIKDGVRRFSIFMYDAITKFICDINKKRQANTFECSFNFADYKLLVLLIKTHKNTPNPISAAHIEHD